MGDVDLQDGSYSLKKYKNGNIISLDIKNFQAFTSQHFRFGPSLNLIAAPNGSGKSSIANAIAFVFNGSPKTVGKSKELLEYIKFGCLEAEITAEILYNGEVIKLSRRITGTQNQYYMNGKLVFQKAYVNLLRQMKIDVNNLCTFLSQERVGEFCRMNPKELLEETLKNSGIETNRSKEIYDKLEAVTEALSSNSRKKEFVETTLSGIELHMKELKEREECIQRLSKLNYKKDKINFEHLKHQYLVLKNDINDVMSKLSGYDSIITKLYESVSKNETNPIFIEYKKGVDVLLVQNEHIKQIGRSIKANIERIDMLRLDHEKVLKSVEKKSVDIAEKKKELLRLNTECNNTREQLSKELLRLKDKIKAVCESGPFSSILVLNKKLETATIETLEEIEFFIPSLRQLDEKIQNSGFVLSQIQHVSQEIQKKIENLERNKQAHTGQDSMRLDMFRKYHFDSYKGVLWLREHKSMFKDEIIEPLYLHINLQKKYSQYIEPFLGFQALSSFIVKNDQDFSLLANLLKDKQNLSINIAMHIPCTLPGISKANITKFSLDGVLSDFIECRKEHMDFLNMYGHFNTIPISTRELNEEDVYAGIPECKRMAVANRYSEIKRSRYGNDYAIVTNRLVQKGLFNFPTLDIDAINLEMISLQNEREKNKLKFEAVLEEKTALALKKEQLLREFDTTHASKLNYTSKRLLTNIDYCEKQLKEIEATDYSLKIKLIDDKIQKIEEIVASEYKALETVLDLENIPSFNLDLIKSIKLDIDNDQRQVLYNAHLKSVEEARLKDMSRQKSELRPILEELKAKLKSCTSFKDELSSLPETIEELECEIGFLEAKLRVTNAQEEIKADYKEKKSLLTSIFDDITSLTDSKEVLEKQYEEEKKRLLLEITKVISPVGEVFDKLFCRFGFTGKLELDSTGRDWELKILVKFREKEELQQLSNSRQSGGEKSLTTALFLLSLQQCDKTAFRLVDEINQGMDSYNERKVFEILKEMGDNSQFFIITPKLVTGLEFSESTTAIVVYGGPGISKSIENYARSILC
ncbi:hypothetical protein GINT2_000769 [Glugoides intestinalis]